MQFIAQTLDASEASLRRAGDSEAIRALLGDLVYLFIGRFARETKQPQFPHETHDLQTKKNNVNAERVRNIFLGIDIKHQTVLELFQRQ